MNDRTIVFNTFYNPIEAQIIKTRLEDGGFSCFLADENTATIYPLYNQAIGGVRLIVFERDQEEITKFLAEDNSLNAEHTDAEISENEGQVVCEKCGSSNVGYGMATKKKFSWWVIALSVIVGVFYPFKGKKCYHCYQCGHEF